MQSYSTDKISKVVIDEISDSLRYLKFGSVEIFVCHGKITQISKRIIKKTIECDNKLDKS